MLPILLTAKPHEIPPNGRNAGLPVGRHCCTASIAYGEFIPPTLNLFGNRDFDKAPWLNLGHALSRERVDQQALWPRMAGGSRQGADDVPCKLSALHQTEIFRHPCIQAASR